MATASDEPTRDERVNSKVLVVVAPGDGARIADVAASVVAEVGDVAAIMLPRSTDDLRPRDHLPRALFSPPQFGEFAAIIECRASVDAFAAFSGLCERAGAAGIERLAGYVVEESVVLDGPRFGAGAESTPPLKMMAIGRWNPEVVAVNAAFHWRNVHGPLALRHHVGMSRYVQNVVTGRLGSALTDIDLIAELWFATATDLLDRFYDSPEGRRIIAADAKSFSGGGDTHFCVEVQAGWPMG